MSIIVKSKEDITKSPLNVSSSKAMFSFSRAERFPKIKQGATSSTYFYNLPEVKARRAASIGKGTKYDFTREHKDKNAQFYNLGSDFDQAHPYSPKFTFGIGREHYGKVYYDTNKMFDKDVPGPGKYNYLKDFGAEAAKFSIKGKPDEKGLVSQSKMPGPGQYPITLQINKEGKYPVSKFKNATRIIFGANKAERFNYSYNNFPGPQKYNIQPLINGEGKIFVSKFKSSPGKTITSRHEIPSLTKNVPGPGAYRYFSEWGVYESKNAHNVSKTDSGSRSPSHKKEEM